MAKSPKRRVIKSPAANQNCWMVTTARTAMRSNIIPQLPKNEPLLWVLKNKLKVSMANRFCFDSYINYSDVRPSPIVKRESYLDKTVKARLVKGRITPMSTIR